MTAPMHSMLVLLAAAVALFPDRVVHGTGLAEGS